MAEEEMSSLNDDDSAFDPATDKDVTLDEVEETLKNLPNHKCPGSDLQPYEIYKYSGTAGARVM